MFYQSSVIKKYLAMLDNEQVNTAWEVYKSYFLNPEIQDNIRSMNEEQFQEGFLRELFVKVFGYSLKPSPNYNLITEKKNETDAKKADGAIIRDEKVIGIIELKDHKTTDLKHVEPQAFGYKNQHRDAHYVIISNFEKLRFYIDNAVDCLEWNLFSLTAEQFRTLYFCLSWANISIDLPLNAKLESVSNEDKITQQLYKDYSSFKREIFADILANNTDSDTPKEHILLLFKKTQKLLDRLLFIFFAEDSGLLPPNSMILILEDWQKLKEMDEYRPLYSRIRKYFGYLDTGFQGKKYEIFAYNGGLFKPDEVLDSLKISDDLLASFTRKLADYDYSTEVDVNILGHIFENSLNEIEEVTAQINAGEAPTVSKRKRDGVFYTPQYITKYIVENTVGRLCAEKKAEMGIIEAEYFSDKNRQMATKKRLLDNLDAYREWLKEITICDPACGSGAFLNAALRFLMDEHKLLDEMEKKLTGFDIPFPGVENYILEKNLYGVDINEESVEIARLALWLRTAKPHRKLNSLNNNIKCGNSLISDPEIAGEKAFDWEKEFPQVFAKGGFDIVIGNPPYVDSETMTKSIPEQREYISQNYQYAKGNWDLLVPFIEKAYSLLRETGKMAFITSNKWLALDYGTAIRTLAVPHLSFLVDCTTEKVFDSANVSSVVFGLDFKSTNAFKIGIVKNAEIINIDTLNIRDVESLITNNLSLAFSKGISIIAKLNQFAKIKDLGYNVFGSFTTGEAYLLVPFVNDNPIPSSAEFKLINTGTIDKYSSLCGKSEIKYLGKQLQYPVVNKENFRQNFPNRYEKLNKPKVIITGIRYFEAIIDSTNEYLPAKSTVAITGDLNALYYLIVILNSRIINFYIRENYYSSSMGGGINFTPDLIRTLPIPNIPENVQPFIDLAEKMLSLNKDLQDKRARFIRRLQDNMPDIKITGTLETFDTLDFAGFIAELKKQKIKLSLVQQDEWEDFFNDYKAACCELVAKITETDKEIDTRVYDLYGLTEDERQLIES